MLLSEGALVADGGRVAVSKGGWREAPASQDRAASERQRQGGRLLDATRERERERERERWAGVEAAAAAAAMVAAEEDKDEGVAAEEDAGAAEAASSGGGILNGARRSSARSTPSANQRSE